VGLADDTDSLFRRAGLYVPLRVLIYENEPGKTCVEYDKPSSLFGQFGTDPGGLLSE
jgi:uncharacterized protein (DUF302 family)